MIHIQLIEWERRLEFEEKRRKGHRAKSYVNYLAAPQPNGGKHKFTFARIFRHPKEGQGHADFVQALSYKPSHH